MMRLWIEKILAQILVIIFIATILTVTWQVVGRYVTEAPSSSTEEIARFLLIWLGLLSSCYAFIKRMHVGIDLISAKLSDKYFRYLARFIWLICLIFALIILVYGGGHLVHITFTLGQKSSAMSLPIWTIYTVLPLSGLIISYYSLCYLIDGVMEDKSLDSSLLDIEAQNSIAPKAIDLGETK